MFNSKLSILVVFAAIYFVGANFIQGQVSTSIMWAIGSFILFRFLRRLEAREDLDTLDSEIEELEFEWSILEENDLRGARQLLLQARELYRASGRKANALRLKRLELLITTLTQFLRESKKQR